MDELEEKRIEVAKEISKLLITNPFTFEVKVAKNPKGIKVIYEVTEEEMKTLVLLNKK